RAGHLPVWDSSRFLGVPYAADPSMGTFYPPNWLYAVGSVPVVATLIWAATVLVSLLLTYWFLSLLRLHPFAAALGAIAWTFSGFMTAWGTGDAVMGAAVWLPMALGGLEVARRGTLARGATIAGVALALSALAGQPQVSSCVWLATGLWALATTGAAMLRARRTDPAAVGKELGRGAAAAGGAFVFGLGLASVQILGTLEYGLLAVAGVGVAFGTPLMHLLFLDVPLLSRFGGINHMALLIDAGLAGLAALGLDALLTDTATSARVALAGCAAVAVAVAFL